MTQTQFEINRKRRVAEKKPHEEMAKANKMRQLRQSKVMDEDRAVVS